MPRCGQMSRSAKTRPSRARPISTGSPSSVLCTIFPGRSSAPTSATYHNPRSSSALSSCMVLFRGCRAPGGYVGVNSNRCLHRHERQIGIAGLATDLRQHAMHLAAMMGLVIEHVRDQQPLRLADFGLPRAGKPGEVAVERGGVEGLPPVEDCGAEISALALKVCPVPVGRNRLRKAAPRTRRRAP